MRHSLSGRYSPRGVTARRLAAAERALRLERESLPLFAEQVAAEQPTAVQRIERHDASQAEYFQRQRELAAVHWRWGRLMLRLHPEHAADIMAKWNQSRIPPTAAYFADFVRTELKRRGVTLP